MLNSFLTFINQQSWQLNKKRTLLTVSGGLDSAVLAHLFYKSGLDAGIAHCNFGLRGEESEADEEFVKQLAESYGFDFFLEKPDVKSFKSEQRGSTQMAARTLRYEWFEKIRGTENFDWIATAHHANDSIETLILNLARGTGAAGLAGIPSERQHLIRPLIRFSRQEIYDYAQANQLEWREDSSNSSDAYARNLVRHKVMPVLQQLNPSLEHTFSHTSERLSAASRIVQQVLKEWKTNYVKVENGQFIVSKIDILATSEPNLFLWFIIEEFGFNYAQNRQVIEALTGLSGKMFSSPTHTLLVDREAIIIRANAVDEQIDYEISSLDARIELKNGSISFTVSAVGEVGEIDKLKKNVAFFDAQHVHLPLKIRRWKTGDTFAPLGMGGKSKKVSDLFTDLKVNRFEKQNALILLNGNGDIMWVIGYRTDERYKLTHTSQDAVMISFEKFF